MKSTSTLARPSPKTKRTRAGNYIVVDGVRVRYLEAGEDNPGAPLVLLHGYRAGADLLNPRPLADLAENFHVIAPDLPGYGYSGRLARHDLASYADFMNRFLDALQLGPVNLMGHSMGGQVAAATAAAGPLRVNKLILVSSSGLPRTGPVWRTPFEMLADASARHWRLYPASVRLFLATAAGYEGVTMIRHQFISGHLKSLTMPTLIIWGSRDRIVPLEHGALIARMTPNSRLAVMRGAGHMPFYQKPEEFNRMVVQFLKQPPSEKP
jgi:pimeloyl-ACP methyl ester carboxylesterase